MKSKDRKYNIVIDHIKEMLKRKELGIGDKLPPERILAQNLEVSRATVSEAIKIMEIIGLIKCTQGGGNYIHQNLEKIFNNPLSSIYLMSDTFEMEILEFRRMIEVQAIEVCIEKITHEEILELEGVHRRLQESQDEEELAKLDKKFHYLIAKSSKNPFVVAIFNSISNLLEDSIKTSRRKVVNKYGKSTIEVKHQEILDAIKAKDKSRAKQAISDHLMDVEASIK